MNRDNIETISYESIETKSYYNTLNDYYSYITLTTTVNDTLNPHTAIIIHELQPLIDINDFNVVYYNDIPINQHGTIMPSYLLVKDKIKADDILDKSKARCVIGGNYFLKSVTYL